MRELIDDEEFDFYFDAGVGTAFSMGGVEGTDKERILVGLENGVYLMSMQEFQDKKEEIQEIWRRQNQRLIDEAINDLIV